MPTRKDGVYITNFDDKTHWLSLFTHKNGALYFDSFVIECIPLELLNKNKNKSINHNIFRIQDNDSIICEFYCIAFIEYIPAGKTFLDYTNLFSLNDYKKNEKIIYKYFKDKYDRRSKSWIWIKKNWRNKKLKFRWNKHNYSISKNYKKTCKYLNYVKQFFILASKVTDSVSVFASLVVIPVGIMSLQ